MTKKINYLAYLLLFVLFVSASGFKFFWQKPEEQKVDRNKSKSGFRFFWQKPKLDETMESRSIPDPKNMSVSTKRKYTLTKYEDKKHFFKIYFNAKAWRFTKDISISPDGVQLLFKEHLLGIGEERLTVAPSVLIDTFPLDVTLSVGEIKEKLASEITENWKERNVEVLNYFSRQNIIEINATTESENVKEGKAKMRFLYVINEPAAKIYRIIMICKADEFGRAENVLGMIISTFEYFSSAENLVKNGKTIPPAIYNTYFKT